jgi:hypothetical protein
MRVQRVRQVQGMEWAVSSSAIGVTILDTNKMALRPLLSPGPSRPWPRVDQFSAYVERVVSVTYRRGLPRGRAVRGWDDSLYQLPRLLAEGHRRVAVGLARYKPRLVNGMLPIEPRTMVEFARFGMELCAEQFLPDIGRFNTHARHYANGWLSWAIKDDLPGKRARTP